MSELHYKISDTPLKLKEYGRNIQSMVEYAKSVTDREKRTQIAHQIVEIMSNLKPHLREIPDYKQKLWDHLLIISDFNLDVDSPYPLLSRETHKSRVKDRLPYHHSRPAYRQYGWNVELMIQKAIKMEEGKAKENYINLIANTMKQFLRNMDRETTPENVIADHIREISRDRLDVKGDDLTINRATTSHKSNHRNNGYSNNKRHNRNGKGRRRK